MNDVQKIVDDIKNHSKPPEDYQEILSRHLAAQGKDWHWSAFRILLFTLLIGCITAVLFLVICWMKAATRRNPPINPSAPTAAFGNPENITLNVNNQVARENGDGGSQDQKLQQP